MGHLIYYELYLVQNDVNDVNFYKRMGITDSTVNKLEHFNDEIDPKAEEEQLA